MEIIKISRRPKATVPTSTRRCMCRYNEAAIDRQPIEGCGRCGGTGEYYKRTEAWEWAQYRRDLDRKPRLYISPEDETVVENFTGGRFTRPYRLFRESTTVLLGEQVPVPVAVLTAVGLDPSAKLRWSQRAGCNMCPCSPGFIVEAEGDEDIFVTYRVEDEDVLNLTPQQERAAANRRAVLGLGSGRGTSGKLRNFRAMSDAKLALTYEALTDEAPDAAAISAVRAELDRRSSGK